MKRFDTINVIPFIDIMLVLLAIVLTTATFIAQGKLDIRLPPADHSQPTQEITTVEIAIDQHQQIYYNSEPHNLAELKSQLALLSPETPITLRVDGQVPFARFIAIIDQLKHYHLEQLSILAQDQ